MEWVCVLYCDLATLRAKKQQRAGLGHKRYPRSRDRTRDLKINGADYSLALFQLS